MEKLKKETHFFTFFHILNNLNLESLKELKHNRTIIFF